MRPATAPRPSAFRNATSPRNGSAAPAAPLATPDTEIARLFSELRHYLGLSIPDAAHRLATRPDVIAALEMGRIDRLPHWNETARIVHAYVALAGLDPRAAVERIGLGLRGMAQTVAVEVPVPAPHPLSRLAGRLSRSQIAQGAEARSWDWQRLARPFAGAARLLRSLYDDLRSARHPVRWVLAGAVGLILVASAAPSGVLQASVNGISSPISGLWRSLSGPSSQVTVTVREGHRWIEADDPRSRRTDKLPTPRS